ncbi:NACHT domain-containing protein [Bernardetia sp. OM2101]|uniref:NACHT domain-containing protein n=1 Tax=Bernardetia sp. OM2101 TaxID=3344876 RepID=UPI0035CF70A3
MLNTLEERYKERLSKKMEGENLKIEFEPKYTKVGTTQDYRNIVLNHYHEGKTVNTSTLYNDFLKKKQLLIIGEAGSGKTVLLLTIAQKLIAEAKKRIEKNDISYPYPILLNLATWRTEDKYTFKEWLEKNLVYAAGRSGVSKKYAKELVEENNMILFLDGLDEIPESDRKDCVIAMKHYFEEKSRNSKFPIGIICCRKNEYLKLKQDLPTRAITEIVPLTLEKVKEQLKLKNIIDAEILLNIIEENKKAIEKANYLTTVFEINIALILAQSYLLSDFRLEKLETQNLIDAYINQEVQKVEGYEGKPKKVKHYLLFLSENLKGENFELSNIADRWSNPNLKERDVTFFSFFFSISFALIGITSTIIYLITEAIIQYSIYINYKNSIIGINGMLILSVLKMYILSVIFKNIIEYRSKKYNSLSIRINLSKTKLRIVYKVCFLFISVITLLFFIDHSITRRTYLELLFFTISSSLLSSISFVNIRTPYIKKAYTRLINSFIYDFVKFFPYLLVNIILLYVTNDQYETNHLVFTYLYSFIMIIFIMNNISSYIVEYILLIKSKKIPIGIIDFIDKVSQTGLMEKDGGQWRFRHQLIQDRLAGKEIKKN